MPVTAPSLGTQEGGQYQEEGGGNFLTKKVGPLPMWAIIAAGLVILYVLYTKYFANTNSSSNPAVTSNPSTDTTSTTLPWDNLSNQLSQIQSNESTISQQLGSLGTAATPITSDPVNKTSTAVGFSAPTASPIYSRAQVSGGTGTGLTSNGKMAVTPTSTTNLAKTVPIGRIPTETPSAVIPAQVQYGAARTGQWSALLKNLTSLNLNPPSKVTSSAGVYVGRPAKTGPTSF